LNYPLLYDREVNDTVRGVIASIRIRIAAIGCCYIGHVSYHVPRFGTYCHRTGVLPVSAEFETLVADDASVLIKSPCAGAEHDCLFRKSFLAGTVSLSRSWTRTCINNAWKIEGRVVG
jgi:hypothetical protein